MRKANYEGFQTEFLEAQNASQGDALATFSSINKALKAMNNGQKRIRLVLYRKRLRKLPPNLHLLARVPYLELDLSDNPALNLVPTLQTLSNLPNLKALDLSGLRMEDLPAEIGLLTSLEQLILYSNGLESLPTEISQLTNLQYLNLRSNKVRDLGPIFTLSKLRRLILRNNFFTKKTFDQIDRLSALEYLDVRRCGIIRLPNQIGYLFHLHTLEVSGNNIRQLPETFRGLKSLKKIHLNQNAHLDWSQAFTEMAYLPNLTELDLQKHDLTELVPAIGKMQQIEILRLSSNALQVLPQALQTCTSLHYVDINYNPALDWKQALQVLGMIPSLRTLEINDPRLESIPTTIGELTNLDALTFRDLPLVKRFPAQLGKLSQLKKLTIQDCKVIHELPEAIGQLQSLEALILIDLIEFAGKLPDTTRNLKQLHQLSIINTPVWELPKGIEELAQVEEVVLGDYFQEFPQELCRMTSLKKLSLSKSSIKKLPAEIAQLQNLEDLDYGEATSLNLIDAFAKVASLKNIKRLRLSRTDLRTLPEEITQLTAIEELDLRGCLSLDMEQTNEVLSPMLALKTLRLLVNEQALPANLPLLKHLATIQIDYPPHHNYLDMQAANYLPLEWGLFENTWFESNTAYFDKTNEFIQQYGQLDYPKDRKMCFYGGYVGNFDGLLEFVENPFQKSSFSLERSLFFLTGKIGGFTQKEVKEKFSQYGIRVSGKITTRVTHAIIGRHTKPEILGQIMAKPIAIVLEDYLKDFIWSQDQPYLMAADTTDMTNHVTSLLMSEDEGNFQLALQIVEGGGANATIVTYLMVISLFYPDNDIRKEARKLFKKYAPTDLQQHVRTHWRTSLRDKIQSYYLRNLVKHAEIDVGEFMVMRTRVSWAGIRSNVQRSYLKETIDLSQMGLLRLPESMTSLKSIRKVNLSINHQLDFAQIFAVLKELPALEEVILSNCKISEFPVEILALKQLKKLDIAHNQIKVLPGQLQQLEALEELILDGNPLHTLEPEFFQLKKLKKLFARNCELESLPDEIQHLKQLQVLALNNNLLKTLPASMEHLQWLKELHLNDNALETLPEPMGLLEELVRISLKNNRLKTLPQQLRWSKIYKLDLENNQLRSLPESVVNCKYLNEIKLRGNHITSLPDSLAQLTTYYFNIDISHNGLTEVPEVLGKIKQLRTLNLSHNQLTELPGELSKAQQLYYLRAANNQITELPIDFHMMVKLSSIDLSYNQIKELPDQLPPAFQDSNVYRGTFSLYGNPISLDNQKQYLQKFKGLRF
ncbi:hypothetical protein BKI52_38695 [marine bacterium AO1-C]|nr:hypothetical protein BKI52_38695 [marine bacterium AO1-C]